MSAMKDMEVVIKVWRHKTAPPKINWTQERLHAEKTTAGHATCQSAKLQVECQRFSASFTSLNFLTDVGPKQGQTSAKMVLQYTWMEPCSWDGPIFYRPCWDQRVDLSPTHGDARVRQNCTGGQSALHLLWRCDVKPPGSKAPWGDWRGTDGLPGLVN